MTNEMLETVLFCMVMRNTTLQNVKMSYKMTRMMKESTMSHQKINTFFITFHHWMQRWTGGAVNQKWHGSNNVICMKIFINL